MIKRSALAALLAAYGVTAAETAVARSRPIAGTTAATAVARPLPIDGAPPAPRTRRVITYKRRPVSIGGAEIRKMITRLANDGGEITIDQIRREFRKLGITAYDWNIKQTFSSMANNGSLIRRGRGRYAAPSSESGEIATADNTVKIA